MIKIVNTRGNIAQANGNSLGKLLFLVAPFFFHQVELHRNYSYDGYRTQ
jgi:hypothetical protein